MHVVMTVKPTLVHGGHFYSGVHVNRTLHGIRLNNFHGPRLTNFNHLEACALLHRMVLYAHDRYVKIRETREPQPDDLPYSPSNLAALIMLTGWQPGYAMVFRHEDGRSQHAKAQVAAAVLKDWAPVVGPLTELRSRMKEWIKYKEKQPIIVE